MSLRPPIGGGALPAKEPDEDIQGIHGPHACDPLPFRGGAGRHPIGVSIGGMAKSGVVYVARKTKESRIKAEKARLEALYNDLPESRHKLADGLIERAAFMRVELEDLEDDIRLNGWVEMFSQGNQEPYPRARPQGQSYNTMNANYLKTIQKLDTMLPKEQGGSEDGDGFDAFVNGRDKL